MTLLRRSMEHEGTGNNKSGKGSTASMYLRSLAYSTIYSLHRSYTQSILLQQSLNSELQKSASKRRNYLLAGLTYFGGQPLTPPMENWMVQNIISTRNYTVEPVSSHPLHRSQLEKVMNLTLKVRILQRIYFYIVSETPMLRNDYFHVCLFPKTGVN